MTKDTKARLLDAALVVHAKRGLAGLTIHAVVAESGISLGSLYHHYGSFDGLLAALYARSLGAWLDVLADDVLPQRTARSGIRALVLAYLGFTERRTDEARFVHAASYAAFLPEHAATIQEVIAPRVARLLVWAQPFVDEGTLVPLSPAVFEALVVGPAAEVARRWLAGVPGWDLDTARAELPERTWRAVRRERSRGVAQAKPRAKQV